jgi:hypothetical protein
MAESSDPSNPHQSRTLSRGSNFFESRLSSADSVADPSDFDKPKREPTQYVPQEDLVEIMRKQSDI